MEKYSIQYFIDKFEKIPEELWITGLYFLESNPECRCAYGHCGVNGFGFSDNREAIALGDIFSNNYGAVTSCNDDLQQHKYKGSTPKQRILNFLKGLKDETN